MKTMICRMALMVALPGLVSCGLKGPLYFPSEQHSTTGTQIQNQSEQVDTSKNNEVLKTPPDY